MPRHDLLMLLIYDMFRPVEADQTEGNSNSYNSQLTFIIEETTMATHDGDDVALVINWFIPNDGRGSQVNTDWLNPRVCLDRQRHTVHI